MKHDFTPDGFCRKCNEQRKSSSEVWVESQTGDVCNGKTLYRLLNELSPNIKYKLLPGIGWYRV